MDRLVKADVTELNLNFIPPQNSSATFNLSNLMHAMPVAVSLTSTNPSFFSFSHSFAVLKPLSSVSFTLFFTQPKKLNHLSSPPFDSVLVRSAVFPAAAKATQDDLRRVFSRTGRHIFKDAKIPIRFNGVSVMSLAVTSGNLDAVKKLISSGYRIDGELDRFLHKSAEMNRVDLIEILCSGYPDLDLNSTDLNNHTALHVAAINGHAESLEFLLTIGCNADMEDGNKWTPLHHAAYNGHVDAVKIILLHGSMFATKVITNQNWTPFELARERNHTRLYDALHSGEALQRAARNGDVAAVKKCLTAEGANVNGRDQNGWTALHRAAFKGRIECVKVLVSYGADVDAVDDSGYAPLHRAVEVGHRAVALYLMAHGAKANLKGIKAKTVILRDFDCCLKKNDISSVVVNS